MLTCPVCLTDYRLAKGSICPDCRVKLRKFMLRTTDERREAVALLLRQAGYSYLEARKLALTLIPVPPS